MFTIVACCLTLFNGSSKVVQRGSKIVQPFPGWEKLDSGSKAIWDKYKNKDDTILEVIIRTNIPMKNKQKKQFDLIGFKYRSIIRQLFNNGSTVVQKNREGSIVTGSIAIKNLQCLASLEFVDYIEAGAPASTKGKK